MCPNLLHASWSQLLKIRRTCQHSTHERSKAPQKSRWNLKITSLKKKIFQTTHSWVPSYTIFPGCNPIWLFFIRSTVICNPFLGKIGSSLGLGGSSQLVVRIAPSKPWSSAIWKGSYNPILRRKLTMVIKHLLNGMILQAAQVILNWILIKSLRMRRLFCACFLDSTVSRRKAGLNTICIHQEFQVPKMEVLNLIRLSWGGFPLHKHYIQLA